MDNKNKICRHKKTKHYGKIIIVDKEINTFGVRWFDDKSYHKRFIKKNGEGEFWQKSDEIEILKWWEKLILKLKEIL